MEDITSRFMRYIAVDTQSDEDSDTSPSTAKQFVLARMLADEMREIGVSDVRLDEEHCYVYGMIPANTDIDRTIGFISHMDTALERPGCAAGARIVRDYDGGVIELCEGVYLDPAVFPELTGYIGCDIIVTDGVSLLGADDKSGIAEIMTMAERLLSDPSIPHGNVAIAFTPDEEIGRGTDHFDVEGFGADFAYTVDGGPVGELEYENFNAAAARVLIHGRDIHPGSAKGVMLNAARIGAEFDMLLPQQMKPEYTEKYEGFIHMTGMRGNVGEAELRYIIRDHDPELFEEKKALMVKAAEYIEAKYPGTIELSIREQYRNMRELIEPHMHLIETAEAAFRKCGVEPVIKAIRGGTDGAELTYKGLPCPNLSTGGSNYHSNTEYITVQALEKMADVLTEIVKMQPHR